MKRLISNIDNLYSAVIYSNTNEIAYCDTNDWGVIEKFIANKIDKNNIVEILNTQTNKALQFDYKDYVNNGNELPITLNDLK